ncbi:TIR domain-containing protein [Nodosilinea nodulosa]|uniref:TIR domain-containing protein n=1 Tax=Nodosilinea nodulosa TaxID=416001 RepID=UPI000360298C|nr:TIR domain-containing protein [Nodosilinea nodulosa]
MRIFISYTLRDDFLSIGDLQRFEYFFLNFGEPYIDILHNKSPNPQEYVISNLKQSETFCALITPKYFESNWVRLELDMAIQMSIPIIAIVLDWKTNTSMQRTAGTGLEKVA